MNSEDLDFLSGLVEYEDDSFEIERIQMLLDLATSYFIYSQEKDYKLIKKHFKFLSEKFPFPSINKTLFEELIKNRPFLTLEEITKLYENINKQSDEIRNENS